MMDRRPLASPPKPRRPRRGRRISLAVTVVALPIAALALPQSARGEAAEKDALPGYTHDVFGGPDQARFRPAFKVAQEPSGHLWIGTGADIFRHDGETAALALPSRPGVENFILLSEADGSIWISQARGLSGRLLRIRRGRMTIFGLGAPTPGSPAPLVYSMWRRRDGGLILGLYFGGLLRMGADGVVRPWGIAAGLPPKARVTAFAEDGARLLIATKAGVYWTTDGRRFAQVTGTRDAMALFVRPDGTILAGGEDGVQRLIPDRRGYRAVETGWRVRNITSFVEPRPGELWIATDDNGLSVLRDGGLQRVSQADGLSSNVVRALTSDLEGNIWAATSGGVDRFSPSPFRPVSPAPPPGKAILAIVSDGERRRWIGDAANDISVQSDKATVPFRVASVTGKVGQLARRDPGVWFATDSGFAGVAGGPDSWQRRACHAEADAILPFGADALLVACRGDGLMLVRRGGAAPWHAQGSPRDFAFVRAMAQTDRGDIWIADYDSGLWRLGPGRRPQRIGAAEGLARLAGPPSNVAALFASGDRLIVAGPNALAIWDGTHFVEFPLPEGTCLGDVSAVMANAAGDLWLGGRIGLARLRGFLADPAASVRRGCDQFGDRTGFPDLAVPRFAAPTMLLSGDRPIFVTRRGLVTYATPPAGSAAAPQIILSRPIVDGREAARFVLDPGVGTIQWSMHLLSFRVPPRAMLRYRVAGHEQGWHVATQNMSAIYTGLAPGRYVLEVEALDLDGDWPARRASQTFEILPAFTESRTFYAIVAAAVLAVAVLAFRLRSLSLRRRYAALTAERTRIARDIHDTLLQDFSGAVWQVDATLKATRGDAEHTVKQLAKLMPIFDAMLRDARRAVTQLRHEPGERGAAAPSLEREIDVLVRRLIGDTGITAELIVTGSPRPLPARVAEDLLAVAREAVTNVRRHAQASRIEIILAYAPKGVAVSVTDNGIGIAEAPAGVLQGRWGLAGIRERIGGLKGKCEILAREPTGTIVRCHVPLAPQRSLWQHILAFGGRWRAA